MRVLFSRKFTYAKFCENKTLTKISEFTEDFEEQLGVQKSHRSASTSVQSDQHLYFSLSKKYDS